MNWNVTFTSQCSLVKQRESKHKKRSQKDREKRKGHERHNEKVDSLNTALFCANSLLKLTELVSFKKNKTEMNLFHQPRINQKVGEMDLKTVVSADSHCRGIRCILSVKYKGVSSSAVGKWLVGKTLESPASLVPLTLGITEAQNYQIFIAYFYLQGNLTTSLWSWTFYHWEVCEELFCIILW